MEHTGKKPYLMSRKSRSMESLVGKVWWLVVSNTSRRWRSGAIVRVSSCLRVALQDVGSYEGVPDDGPLSLLGVRF